MAHSFFFIIIFYYFYLNTVNSSAYITHTLEYLKLKLYTITLKAVFRECRALDLKNVIDLLISDRFFPVCRSSGDVVSDVLSCSYILVFESFVHSGRDTEWLLKRITCNSFINSERTSNW